MGVSCQILINKPSEGFHRAGGPVSGTVRYAIDVPTEYKDIKLALKGESYCSWIETDSDEDSTRYTGSQTHVSQVVSLLNGLNNSTLPAGAYEHKFLFTLPKIIPPSFKRQTGHVCYEVVLEFQKHRIINPTKRFTAEIVVLNYLEVNLPITPIVFGLDKTLFKPLSVGVQKIMLKAQIAKPYVKPGEKVELKLMVTNDTTVNIKCIRADLIRKTIYTADCSRQHFEEQRVKQCRTESVEVPSRSNANMIVTMPTSDLEWSVQHSNVINNKYEILVTVRLPIPHTNPTVIMPILLGEREEDIPIEVGVDIVKSMEENVLPPQYNEVVDECTQ